MKKFGKVVIIDESIMGLYFQHKAEIHALIMRISQPAPVVEKLVISEVTIRVKVCLHSVQIRQK